MLNDAQFEAVIYATQIAITVLCFLETLFIIVGCATLTKAYWKKDEPQDKQSVITSIALMVSASLWIWSGTLYNTTLVGTIRDSTINCSLFGIWGQFVTGSALWSSVLVVKMREHGMVEVSNRQRSARISSFEFIRSLSLPTAFAFMCEVTYGIVQSDLDGRCTVRDEWGILLSSCFGVTSLGCVVYFTTRSSSFQVGTLHSRDVKMFKIESCITVLISCCYVVLYALGISGNTLASHAILLLVISSTTWFCFSSTWPLVKLQFVHIHKKGAGYTINRRYNIKAINNFHDLLEEKAAWDHFRSWMASNNHIIELSDSVIECIFLSADKATGYSRDGKSVSSHLSNVFKAKRDNYSYAVLESGGRVNEPTFTYDIDDQPADEEVQGKPCHLGRKIGSVNASICYTTIEYVMVDCDTGSVLQTNRSIETGCFDSSSNTHVHIPQALIDDMRESARGLRDCFIKPYLMMIGYMYIMYWKLYVTDDSGLNNYYEEMSALTERAMSEEDGQIYVLYE